jgi:hypothetical protein
MAFRLSRDEIRLRPGRAREVVWVYSDARLVLGVPAGASRAEAVAAYRRAAMQDHPDRNPGDENAGERFHRLHAAYEEVVSPPAVSVSPREGDGWKGTSIYDSRDLGTVGGIAFELREAAGRARASEEVAVVVGETELPLVVRVLPARRSGTLDLRHTIAAAFDRYAEDERVQMLARRGERALLVVVCAVLLLVAALGLIGLVFLLTGSAVVADVLLLLAAVTLLALAGVGLRRWPVRRQQARETNRGA